MTSSVTPFSLPESCLSTTWAATGGQISLLGRCLSGTLTEDPDCFPPATTTLRRCPADWKAITTINSITTCCPSAFTMYTENPGTCHSFAMGNVLAGLTCNPSLSATNVQKTYDHTPAVWARAISYAAATIPAPTPSTISSTATSSAAMSSTATSSTVTSSIITPPSSSVTPLPTRSRKKKLAGGAIAGIVVGAILAVVLVLAAIAMLRRRRQGTDKTTSSSAIPDRSEAYHVQKPEMDAVSRMELETASQQPPLTQHAYPAELTGHTKLRGHQEMR